MKAGRCRGFEFAGEGNQYFATTGALQSKQ
jgi:hypothetical protein